MNPTRIKMCGFTRQEDATQAVAAGVDAIGLVFYAPSPRAVTAEQAAQIAAVVPPFVTLVGLFVDSAPQDVESVLSQVPLDLLQFHGDESPEYCAAFCRPWVKALRMHPQLDLGSASARYRGARGLLLDAWREDAPGGTGETFDWARIGDKVSMPLVLAGGLHPGNVAQAIEAVRPAAVDVSSGIESSPGVKDEAKIRRFVAAVRGAPQ
ncbi:MAG: phosphoribosylanthranilate isomerase [Halioglobus sp.]|nr:phosphoribosylanthranilate isomerase [Halioglobus sp.]